MYPTLLIIVLTLNIHFGNSQNDLYCSEKLLKKCYCGYTMYDYSRQYVVNCTNTNFKATQALEVLPSETEVLIFTGNNIPELPWNVFGTLSGLEKLRVIDMSNNEIQDIPGKSYHHVTNVELLILNHNKLSIADDSHHPRMFSNFVNLHELHLTNAFEDNTDEGLSNDLHDIFVNSNLSKLKKLHLEQNEIHHFRDKNVFCDLPQLMDLHLGDNLLEEINFNISCLKKLRFLDLERNQFTTFTQNDFDTLDQIVSTARKEPLVIDITKNPFVCSKTRPLVEWINKTKVIVRNKDALTCKLNERDNPILLLERVLQMENVTNNPIAVILIVSLLFLTLICAILYTYWPQIVGKSGPILNSLSRKVHYTSIESQVDYV